jgi:hypothetical protein
VLKLKPINKDNFYFILFIFKGGERRHLQASQFDKSQKKSKIKIFQNFLKLGRPSLKPHP